eukprot:746101-Hanusia_phi.AAC.1
MRGDAKAARAARKTTVSGLGEPRSMHVLLVILIDKLVCDLLVGRGLGNLDGISYGQAERCRIRQRSSLRTTVSRKIRRFGAVGRRKEDEDEVSPANPSTQVWST